MKFTLISCLNQAPAWYRIIESFEELLESNDRFAKFYWQTKFKDPHFESGIQRGEPIYFLQHPLNVLPKRYIALIEAWQKGVKIALNKVGGWMTVDNNCKIIEEKESTSWPDNEKVSDTRLYVYIQKWPMANHYYLSSYPVPILFPQTKYNTYKEAFEEAKKTHERKIY